MISALSLIVALLAGQDAAAAAPLAPDAAKPAPDATASPAPAADEPPYPPGAPRDDYGLVAWCAGALGGYLELHDKVLPEVDRIEAAFQKPGTTHAADMKLYADMRKEGLAEMKLFARAMQAAEKASLKPIRAQGAEAMQRGHASWAAAANMPVRTVAQQWMGWALPARCETTARSLEARAKLLGETFNSEAPAPAPTSAPAPDAPPAASPSP